MPAYYNEIDPFAAAWLRELIKAGCIAPGEVDERSIEDVRPDDLRGFSQCHFFAGIGVWSYSLRRAGWPDDRPVWTGSCPCQPFSAASKGGGFADERHLWPAFFHLIGQCRPGTVFGEQVASKDGLAWLDLVQADLEGSGYAVGAVDSCAAGFGAPHIRQRLYWVADSQGGGIGAGLRNPEPGGERRAFAPDGGDVLRLADADSRQRGGITGGEERLGHGPQARREQGHGEPERGGAPVWMGHAELLRCDTGSAGDIRGQEGQGSAPGHVHAGPGRACGLAHNAERGRGEERADAGGGAFGDQAQGVPAGLGAGSGGLRPGPCNGFWRDADWLFCRDGVWRPVEPGTFPLAHGAPARVGRLRGYGNAIVAPQAAAFVKAYMGTLEDRCV